jgi:glycosyltransferase involved in cell wall biosynthesis
VLTLSQFSRREIQRVYRVPADRIAVTYLAADPTFTASADGRAVAECAGLLGTTDPFILFVGTMYRRRRVADLIRAFDIVAAKRSDVRLILVGSDPDREAAHGLLSAAAADRVTLLPHVEESALRSLYQACTASVYLSEYEGFGLPVIEAMACGAPVVTSSTASLPEVAGDAALAVPLDDVASLAGALSRILGDPTLVADLRERGRLQADRFRWDRTARQILTALEQATESLPIEKRAGIDRKSRLRRSA